MKETCRYIDFYNKFKLAQAGDKQSIEFVLNEFLPEIKKYRFVKGFSATWPSEDLMSELYLAAFKCILKFVIDMDDYRLFVSEARNCSKPNGNPPMPPTLQNPGHDK